MDFFKITKQFSMNTSLLLNEYLTLKIKLQFTILSPIPKINNVQNSVQCSITSVEITSAQKK